jgi:plastocyanin
MIRLTALLAVAATALAGVASIGAAPARQAAPVKLSGSVGPGETIVLKKGASRVSTLKRGRYTIVVKDRSAEHNFRIRGPVSRQISSISATGTKTVTLTLKPGRYTYVCDPHSGDMIGSFRVK